MGCEAIYRSLLRTISPVLLSMAPFLRSVLHANVTSLSGSD
jgi:hypothetical protein